MSDNIDHQLREIFASALGLPPWRTTELSAESKLFGYLPELDSISAVVLLTEMEDRLGIKILDAEVDAHWLATYGSILAFAEKKRAEALRE